LYEFCREFVAGVLGPLYTASSAVLFAARAALRFARSAASLSPSSAILSKPVRSSSAVRFFCFFIGCQQRSTNMILAKMQNSRIYSFSRFGVQLL